MRLSRPGYYTDFVLYPVLLTGIASYGMSTASGAGRVGFALAAGSGLLAWTLVEYVVHRCLFHHAPVLAEMHDTHHDDPRDLIGTPTWVSLPLAVVALGLLSSSFGETLGCGLATGLVGGYLWYISVHHLAHHGRLRGSRYLYRARRRHAVHHARETGNFGVTTEFWDRLFGTALADQPAPMPAATLRPTRRLGSRLVRRIHALRNS